MYYFLNYVSDISDKTTYSISSKELHPPHPHSIFGLKLLCIYLNMHDFGVILISFWGSPRPYASEITPIFRPLSENPGSIPATTILNIHEELTRRKTHYCKEHIAIHTHLNFMFYTPVPYIVIKLFKCT